MSIVAQSPRLLARHAVEPRGRRHADGAPDGAGLVVLDHAGPAASRWSKDRAVGVDEVVDPISERRARALDADEWRALVDAYRTAARTYAAGGVACALGVDGDGLLHRAWSPLGTSREPRPERVLEVHRACGPVDVLLTVEDLAPGGLDATDGIELARALVAQGAARIFATAGSSALPALLRRAKGTSSSTGVHLLASAAWLVGRVSVPVIAVVPAADDALHEAARVLGLAGVVVDEVSK